MSGNIEKFIAQPSAQSQVLDPPTLPLLNGRETNSSTFSSCLALSPPDPVNIGSMKPWLNDSPQSSVYAKFRTMNCNLGNRYPTLKGFYAKECIFCLNTGQHFPNNEIHLAIDCQHFEQICLQTCLAAIIGPMRNCIPPVASPTIFKHILDDQKPYQKQVSQSLLALFTK